MIRNGDQWLQVFEALANPHRLRIIAALYEQRKYVSELAREVELSRPLLYMHLKRLESAGLVSGSLELSQDGKAMKFYSLQDFVFQITPDQIAKAVESLSDKAASKQRGEKDDDNEEEE